MRSATQKELAGTGAIQGAWEYLHYLLPSRAGQIKVPYFSRGPGGAWKPGAREWRMDAFAGA